ncbi:hypothetical protein ACPVTF_07640 [Geobacillus icigianus]|uniref:Uncharacterized protein n=1 Tax=Geobacillus subterraneus TaxID=129338 RepID=A0A679FUT4_9BACL|nr:MULTISPECIES: hypothetical protein [Geobacillus]KYD23903.1 hypothetical protein B4113_3268 [Geobacillus sp. B4113_201601]BBW96534.1 hypothetical protein GsuE55_13670 [Geobacillus subterraneus]
MENLEIILSDFKKEKLETLIYDELKLTKLNIQSSHFYDSNLQRDIQFSEVKNIKELLSPQGTGNVVLEQLQLGISLKNVVIVFSFDEEYGDIVFNFPESEIFVDDKNEVKLKFAKLVDYLMNLKIKYAISKVIIGYEPAYDEDTMLIEFDDNPLNVEKVLDAVLDA